MHIHKQTNKKTAIEYTQEFSLVNLLVLVNSFIKKNKSGLLLSHSPLFDNVVTFNQMKLFTQQMKMKNIDLTDQHSMFNPNTLASSEYNNKWKQPSSVTRLETHQLTYNTYSPGIQEKQCK